MRESTLSLNYTVKQYCRLIRSTVFRDKERCYRRDITALLKYYEHSYISEDLYCYFLNRVHESVVVGGFMDSEVFVAFGFHASRAYKPLFPEGRQ